MCEYEVLRLAGRSSAYFRIFAKLCKHKPAPASRANWPMTEQQRANINYQSQGKFRVGRRGSSTRNPSTSTYLEIPPPIPAMCQQPATTSLVGSNFRRVFNKNILNSKHGDWGRVMMLHSWIVWPRRLAGECGTGGRFKIGNMDCRKNVFSETWPGICYQYSSDLCEASRLQQAVGTRAWLRWWHHGDTVTIYNGPVTTGATNESLQRFHNHREGLY